MSATTQTADPSPPQQPAGREIPLRTRLSQAAEWLRCLSTAERVLLGVFGLMIVAGVAWRLAYSINHNDFTGRDQRFYGGLARSLAYHFSYHIDNAHDIFHWAPGAPGAMALGLRLFGEGDSGYRGAYVVQFLASIGSIGVLFFLARRHASTWPALGAAAVLAICTGAITTMADLITEPLGSLGLLVAIGVLAVALTGTPQPRKQLAWGAAAGVVMGVAILTRPDFLPLPFVWVAVIALAWKAPWLQRVQISAVLVAAVAVTMAPWCIWASLKEGTLVTPTTSGTTTYWVGTFLPGNGQTFLARRALADEIHKAYPQTHAIPVPNANFMILTIRKRYPASLSKDEAMGRALRDNIRKYAIGQPAKFWWMMAQKPVMMWNRPYKGHGRERTTLGNLLNLPAMIGALIAVLGALYFRRRNILLALIGATIIAGTCVAVVGPAIPRANARFVPLALLGAAIAIDMLIKQRRARPETPAS
jgi:hypothetical protein